MSAVNRALAVGPEKTASLEVVESGTALRDEALVRLPEPCADLPDTGVLLPEGAARLVTSGDGAAKTWPQAAASAIPTPTYSGKSGSWPEPPPMTTPTFPATGASLRMMAVAAGCLRTSRGFASASPSNSSSVTSKGSLISFLIAMSPLSARGRAAVGFRPGTAKLPRGRPG